MSKLVIFRGDDVENEIHLGGRVVRIGRDSRNDIVLADKSVTRFHAEVRPENGSFVIVDMKSRNGVWMNGRQIKGKAALALGTPVTLGAYELTIEDDVPTSGVFDESALNRTAANPSAQRTTSQSATQRWSTASPASEAKRTAIFWSGLVLATLLLCGVTYAVVRYMMAPAQVAEVAATAPPAPAEPEPAPQAPPVDLTKEAIVKHLADARAAMDVRDYATAVRDHLTPVLELDPSNQEALDLKRLADQAAAAAATPAPPKKAEPPPVVETPGIPRRQGETPADYAGRATRVQSNFQEGRASFDKGDYTTALARFQAVERDQKDYQGVEALIADAAARQKRAAEDAVENGRRNEQAGKLADAVRWYQQALRFDPSSTAAQERISALTERLTRQGMELFARAEVFRKRNDNARAIDLYRQAAELLPSSHEKHREAQEWLEKLKP